MSKRSKSEAVPTDDQLSFIDLSDYVPYFLRATANKLSQASSAEYGKFGIGLNEWSCLALLAREPHISASRISEVSGFDKAVISRSVNSLENKGLVVVELAPNHNRKKAICLSEAGRLAHDEIMAIALARQKILLTGISADERAQLLRFMRLMHANVLSMLSD